MRTRSLPALSAIHLGLLFFLAGRLPAQQVSLPSSELVGEPTGGAAATTADSPTERPALKAAVHLPRVLDALTKVLEDYRRNGNRHEEANTICAIANAYYLLHQEQRSLELYASALVIWKEINDREGTVNTLSAMGDVYREWGFPDRAAHYYRESLASYSDAPNSTRKAATLNGLGVAYLSLRDKRKALEYFSRALVADRDIHDQLAEARTISNLGATYFLLGKEREKALNTLQDAETRMEMLDDFADEGNTLEMIGVVWRSLKKPDVAASSYQRALLVFRKAGNVQGEDSVRKRLRELEESRP